MKKIVFFLTLLTCALWAGAQKNTAATTPISGYSKNLVASYAASGFGLHGSAAGTFQKAGWSILPKKKFAGEGLTLSGSDVALECDRLNTVFKSRKENELLTAKGKKGDVAMQRLATDKADNGVRPFTETAAVSGCDIYRLE